MNKLMYKPKNNNINDKKIIVNLGIINIKLELQIVDKRNVTW